MSDVTTNNKKNRIGVGAILLPILLVAIVISYIATSHYKVDFTPWEDHTTDIVDLQKGLSELSQSIHGLREQDDLIENEILQLKNNDEKIIDNLSQVAQATSENTERIDLLEKDVSRISNSMDKLNRLTVEIANLKKQRKSTVTQKNVTVKKKEDTRQKRNYVGTFTRK